MIRIGIIGAENSHCGHIARLSNLENKVDARVVAVWGETPELAAEAAKAGQIPTVVSDWREMAGQVDGIMIDHRHPKFHFEPAHFFLSKGVPVFVDKPFTHTLAEAKKLCALALRKNVPVTSFSVIAQEDCFRKFKNDCATLGNVTAFSTFGPGDVDEEYGGVFFYGVHQIEAIVELLGYDIERIYAVRQGSSCVAMIHYRNGPIATAHILKHDNFTFHWMAACEKQNLARDHVRDSEVYVGGLRIFLEMFKSRVEPLSHSRLLAPVAILEAIEKSLASKKPVKFPKLSQA